MLEMGVYSPLERPLLPFVQLLNIQYFYQIPFHYHLIQLEVAYFLMT